jgi:hypothetical protein
LPSRAPVNGSTDAAPMGRCGTRSVLGRADPVVTGVDTQDLSVAVNRAVGE